jgi:uncharacterized membrane protein YtjA (UPF0391 family)
MQPDPLRPGRERPFFRRNRQAHPLQRALFSHNDPSLEDIMLYWAAVFFIIALVAGVFGFFGIAAAATGVAKILFFAFLVLAIVSLLVGRRAPI